MSKPFQIFIVLFIPFAFSCKKDTVSSTPPPANPAVWNDNFIGNYLGKWSSQSYTMGTTGPLFIKDSNVVVGKDTDPMKNTTTISNASIVQFDNNSSCLIYHGSITVKADSLLYTCQNGGLGSGVYESFRGKKQ